MVTQRLYHALPADAPVEVAVHAIAGEAVALDRSPFYPGGGGQPPDHGTLTDTDGNAHPVTDVWADEAGRVWHRLVGPPPLAGSRLVARIDAPRRAALSRQHTVLHVLNTVAMRRFDAWITGCQIGAESSRIDFKLERLSPEVMAELEAGVNAVLAADHPVRADLMAEDEFRSRPDLLRTLDVRPPTDGGRVRVVRIEGFDAQACGGTHVAHVRQIGALRIVRSENKGRNNKRLYVRLEPPAAPVLPPDPCAAQSPPATSRTSAAP